jgi:hypothetical protein
MVLYTELSQPFVLAVEHIEDNSMSITVTWDNDDKSIILMTFEQPWTLPELETSQTQLHSLMFSVAHPVDLMLDVSKTGVPPANAMGRFRALSKVRFPNQRLLILVGTNMFVRSMIDAIQRVSNAFAVRDGEMMFAATREEARRMLRGQ